MWLSDSSHERDAALGGDAPRPCRATASEGAPDSARTTSISRNAERAQTDAQRLHHRLLGREPDGVALDPFGSVLACSQYACSSAVKSRPTKVGRAREHAREPVEVDEVDAEADQVDSVRQRSARS